MADNGTNTSPPTWAFDKVEAAIDEHGIPIIMMRVSRTINDGLPVGMSLWTARKLRDDLDAAIKLAAPKSMTA